MISQRQVDLADPETQLTNIFRKNPALGRFVGEDSRIFSGARGQLTRRYRRSASRTTSDAVVLSAAARSSRARRSAGSRRTGKVSAGADPIAGRPARRRSRVMSRPSSAWSAIRSRTSSVSSTPVFDRPWDLRSGIAGSRSAEGRLVRGSRAFVPTGRSPRRGYRIAKLRDSACGTRPPTGSQPRANPAPAPRPASSGSVRRRPRNPLTRAFSRAQTSPDPLRTGSQAENAGSIPVARSRSNRLVRGTLGVPLRRVRRLVPVGPWRVHCAVVCAVVGGVLGGPARTGRGRWRRRARRWRAGSGGRPGRWSGHAGHELPGGGAGGGRPGVAGVAEVVEVELAEPGGGPGFGPGLLQDVGAEGPSSFPAEDERCRVGGHTGSGGGPERELPGADVRRGQAAELHLAEGREDVAVEEPLVELPGAGAETGVFGEPARGPGVERDGAPAGIHPAAPVRARREQGRAPRCSTRRPTRRQLAPRVAAGRWVRIR